MTRSGVGDQDRCDAKVAVVGGEDQRRRIACGTFDDAVARRRSEEPTTGIVDRESSDRSGAAHARHTDDGIAAAVFVGDREKIAIREPRAARERDRRQRDPQRRLAAGVCAPSCGCERDGGRKSVAPSRLRHGRRCDSGRGDRDRGGLRVARANIRDFDSRDREVGSVESKARTGAGASRHSGRGRQVAAAGRLEVGTRDRSTHHVDARDSQRGSYASQREAANDREDITDGIASATVDRALLHGALRESQLDAALGSVERLIWKKRAVGGGEGDGRVRTVAFTASARRHRHAGHATGDRDHRCGCVSAAWSGDGNARDHARGDLHCATGCGAVDWRLKKHLRIDVVRTGATRRDGHRRVRQPQRNRSGGRRATG